MKKLIFAAALATTVSCAQATPEQSAALENGDDAQAEPTEEPTTEPATPLTPGMGLFQMTVCKTVEGSERPMKMEIFGTEDILQGATTAVAIISADRDDGQTVSFAMTLGTSPELTDLGIMINFAHPEQEDGQLGSLKFVQGTEVFGLEGEFEFDQNPMECAPANAHLL